MPIKTISAEEFKGIIEKGLAAQVLDVRRPDEHAAVHLLMPHSNTPVDELEAINPTFNQAQPLYVLCGGGTRATRAAGILEAKGYDNAVVIAGGIRGCQAIGVETNTSKLASCASGKITS